LARTAVFWDAAQDDGMVMDKVVVRSPATLSNLGSGFDVFGLALREPYDIVEARRTHERGVVIEGIDGWGARTITTDPTRNSAGAAALAVLDKANAECGEPTART
jgi:homoserine kinase